MVKSSSLSIKTNCIPGHESGYIGAGGPPIETDKGWLLIYHAVYDTAEGYVYTATAALLDIDDPTKILARMTEPLFTPEFEYEQHGVVNNVVFPTGHSLFEDTLYIYYGAADNSIALATSSISMLLDWLRDDSSNSDFAIQSNLSINSAPG